MVARIVLMALIGLGLAPAAWARQELVFLFQKQKEPAELRAAAEGLGSALEQRLRRPVRVVVPLDYSASVQALISGQADVAYLSALPFLLARRDGGAEMLLAEQRVDAAGNARTDYDAVWVVRRDSPLRNATDLARRSASLRLAFTSPTSTSGYVFPYRSLIDAGVLPRRGEPRSVFQKVGFAGSYTQALREVLEGRADVAAVSDYTVEGTRTDLYVTAEQRARLRILGRIPGVPTHVIAVRRGLDPSTRDSVRAALLGIAATDARLLADVYGATRFVAVDERQHVAAAIHAIEATGLPIEGLAR